MDVCASSSGYTSKGRSPECDLVATVGTEILNILEAVCNADVHDQLDGAGGQRGVHVNCTRVCFIGAVRKECIGGTDPRRGASVLRAGGDVSNLGRSSIDQCEADGCRDTLLTCENNCPNVGDRGLVGTNLDMCSKAREIHVSNGGVEIRGKLRVIGIVPIGKSEL